MKPAVKKTLFIGITGLLTIVFLLIAAEILILLFMPQISMVPRYKFDNKYALLLFPNTRIVHSQPRRFHFEYQINEQGQRGNYIKPQDAKNTVVVLGDSYSFGLGVEDGKEYPAVLNSLLAGSHTVINLGVPGWSITQEIRRYYEFGRLYQPRAVILQFCGNDISDSIKNPVTLWDGTQFKFQDTNNFIYRILSFLSRSPLQKSQLYNFIRQQAYLIISRQRIASQTGGRIKDQQYYIELLTAFAQNLKKSGIRLILISVQGDLESFEILHKSVMQLEAEGFLQYEDTRDWLNGQTDLISPEGHRWNAKAHRIIAENLAGVLKEILP